MGTIWGLIDEDDFSARKSGTKIKNRLKIRRFQGDFWQGHKDLNPEPTVLETAALPIELYPYILVFRKVVGLRGLEPGTVRL